VTGAGCIDEAGDGKEGVETRVGEVFVAAGWSIAGGEVADMDMGWLVAATGVGDCTFSRSISARTLASASSLAFCLTRWMTFPKILPVVDFDAKLHLQSYKQLA